ncbi:MAG TPA: hypothetical protein VIJ61_03145, partial [Thermoanaerobaculia bacterium]
ERVFGYVESLQQEAQEVSIGDLAITTVIDRREIKVRLSLHRPDYDQAIVAFREKRPIEITGDLLKEGRHWVLRNPRDLVLHTVPPSRGAT